MNMQSVLNAFRVLEEIAVSQPIGVSELARRLDQPKTSTQRTLLALQKTGWIRPAGDTTRWLLTSRPLAVARHVGEDLGLRDAAQPEMEELRRQTGETIHLTVPEGRSVVLIERLDSYHALRTVNPLGGRAPIYASAGGKAILASWSPAEFAEIARAGLRRHTGTTITDPENLARALQLIRDQGYAVNRGEWSDDVGAVAAAIIGPDGRAIAAVSISAPRHRLPDEAVEGYGRLVVEAARRISAAVGYRPVNRLVAVLQS